MLLLATVLELVLVLLLLSVKDSDVLLVRITASRETAEVNRMVLLCGRASNGGYMLRGKCEIGLL